MSVPDKKIVPFDADLGALLPEGPPDAHVSRLPYLRLAMPTSRFLYDSASPICALKPNLATSSWRSDPMSTRSTQATRVSGL